MKIELDRMIEKLRALSFHLSRSYNICKNIPLDNLTNDELDKLEALTARFERACDVFTGQYLRLLDAVEANEEGTLIDALNRAEKRGIIDSANDFVDMKYMRNRIAHEYATAEIDEIAKRVLHWTPMLLDGMRRAQEYRLPF